MDSEPRLRPGVPDGTDDAHGGSELPGRPPVDPALIRPFPARRIGDAVRWLRRRGLRDPDAEPSLGRMLGQFSLFALAIFATMVVIVLPCVVGILVWKR